MHESALLRTVRPSELQGLAFAKATKKERAPNVVMLIAHFNRLSRWVCTQVRTRGRSNRGDHGTDATVLGRRP